ncbi:TPA: winged helix-turn-helix domain-containing protein [Citrobacter sedlakii]|nr:winged helix-turn-helix domain-containing protein [Citrobacter sedlakii]HCA7081579.1 winged helix-turn-helix domain-containing protein [Citrobacter sedlakii]HCA7134851.1 winged helix-turn-helix domain-containing protein [Citrobacter sedlakii]HCA7138156.1 winged helix-turn-helix domain-containing protein [Citrobacter sedlakii]HCA7180819.1 winged helix-turn-helix domain-containing protein [Citrobacter sedlakii]
MSIVVNKWRMDPSLNALIHCETGETRRLGEYHYILLETLVKNADTVLSRSYLMTEVWKNRIVGGNSLPTAIHALRVAIDDDGKQQEIIKTIPKKGYLFNKHYLTVSHSADNQQNDETNFTFDEEIPTESVSIPQMQSLSVRDDAVAPQSPALVEPQKRGNTHSRLRIAAVAAGVVIVAMIVLAFPFLHQTPSPPSDVPELIKENQPLADRVEIYHVVIRRGNSAALTPMSSHIENGLIKANELLLANKATMRVFYKVSFNKFDLTLIVKNQCKKSWQLVLAFENWQGKDNEMNNVLFQEVEKMLNDMPKCN